MTRLLGLSFSGIPGHLCVFASTNFCRMTRLSVTRCAWRFLPERETNPTFYSFSASWEQAAIIPTLPEDYDAAAALYRQCRRGGETVRKLLDCLIAAVAIRAGIPVLHNDRDFDGIARHTELQLDAASR